MTKLEGRKIGLALGALAIVILYFTEPVTPIALEVVRVTYVVASLSGILTIWLWIRGFYTEKSVHPTFDSAVHTFTGMLFAYSVVLGLLEGRLPEPGFLIPLGLENL